MMDLDNAIKHAEEVAEGKEKLANTYESFKDFGNPKSSITSGHEKCLSCAAEHRQLAEWLKELKQFKESAILLDRVKEAEKEISDWNVNRAFDGCSELYRLGVARGLDIASEILDKLIAESEGKEC